MICNKCGERFEFRCSLNEKPDTHDELWAMVAAGIVKPQVGEDYINIGGEAANCRGELETDFTTQKPIRYNINWIRTEDS